MEDNINAETLAQNALVQAVEAGDSKEINIMSSEGTIPDLSQN